MKHWFFIFSMSLNIGFISAQNYTRKDSLRGSLRHERTCFDVHYYDLNISVDLEKHFIKGKNTVYYTLKDSTTRLQFDLFQNMQIDGIMDEKGYKLEFKRVEDAVFVNLHTEQSKGQQSSITINYSGNPIEAKSPPWDGGFIWKKDKQGNHWVGVACEGIGASLWWPNKDHLSDEPDSMQISVNVPEEYMAVCNGNLKSEIPDKGRKTWTWKINYPINNYNVTLNIARYVHFKDTYQGVEGNFDLDYYVLPDNLDKAKIHFKQVKPMFDCYEKLLGPYPFPKDGFALVETPYLGMEHQGAIAYGNNYLKGYSGFDYSLQGLDFDYIIIHETGHEYWGNSVSMEDIADMWIHEGFCTYSEALYVECVYGKETALNYCNSWKYRVANDKPIIGDYGVNSEGSVDMYYKGALMLHTLRWVVNNDSLWFNTILSIQKDFRFKITSTNEIIQYMNQKLGKDYTWLFDQYLRSADAPVLEIKSVQKSNQVEVQYRWKKATNEFKLPVSVIVIDQLIQIFPSLQWQSLKIKDSIKDDIKIDESRGYFILNRIE